MKIVLQNIVWLLSFVAYNYFCLATHSIRIGAFYNEGQTQQELHLEENEDVSYTVDVKTVSDSDSYDAVKTLCEMTEELGVSAVFGPKSLTTSQILESLCSYFGIPYIITNWHPKLEESSETIFNVFPDADLLSLALKTVVQGLDWKTFIVLYDNEDNLIKLHDILKLQLFDKHVSQNSISLKLIDTTNDYRSLLKELSNSSFHIVLDCQTDKIIDILKQAHELNVITFSTSFFITSLDAHTLDYSFLSIGNITTIRLFNPTAESFVTEAGEHFPEIAPNNIRVEQALIHDAVLLLSESVNAAIAESCIEELGPGPIICNTTEPYTKADDECSIATKMKEIKIEKFLTGPITFDDWGNRIEFTLEVIEINKEKPIALWSSKNPTELSPTRSTTETQEELEKRLQSHNFTISSRQGMPYLDIRKDENGKEYYVGYNNDLITEIANIMKIKFKFHIVKTYNDLIDDLIYRKADMAVGDITITAARREIIDFSEPFMSLGISILYRKHPEEELDILAFMRPFSWSVWIYTASLYLVITIVLYFVTRLTPEDWESAHPCDEDPEELENVWDLKNCLWLTMGSIMTQGCDILPKGKSSRMVTSMWWFFSLIMTSSYTANLAAFLTMKKMENQIQNVEDLAQQSKIKYGAVTTGTTKLFFKNSNSSLYQKMWNNMETAKPSVFEPDNPSGVERVKSDKKGLYAFLMESTQIEYVTETECDLEQVGDWLDYKSYGIAMPMNVEYRNSVNVAILKLKEDGVLNLLKDRWWKQNRDKPSCPPKEEPKSDADKLSLAEVSGIFMVLIGGVCLALVVAFLEFLWNVHKISVEEHIPYIDVLKAEVKFTCNIWATKKRVKPLVSTSSSSKSSLNGGDNKSATRSILQSASSILALNPSVTNRTGSTLNIDDE